jgi:hypothetical protein
LWGEKGPWKKEISEKRPDILTVQFGLHTCRHAHQNPAVENDYSIVNDTTIDRHIQNIPKLMASIRKAIDRPGENRTQSVIIVTSGAVGSKNSSLVEECILRVNRVASDEAHKQGFAVLDRGEIEHRLMVKSRHSERPLLPVEMHLDQPAQSLISTCLLQLMTCLDREGYNISSSEVPSLINIKQNASPIDAKIIYSAGDN